MRPELPIEVTVRVPGNDPFVAFIPHGTDLPLDRDSLDELVSYALREAERVRVSIGVSA